MWSKWLSFSTLYPQNVLLIYRVVSLPNVVVKMRHFPIKVVYALYTDEGPNGLSPSVVWLGLAPTTSRDSAISFPLEEWPRSISLIGGATYFSTLRVSKFCDLEDSSTTMGGEG